MDNSSQPFNRSTNELLFDRAFAPLSYFSEDDKLLGIDIAIQKRLGNYVLAVATAELYTNRSGDDDNDEDAVLVIPKNEILPSDLLLIKHEVLDGHTYDEFLLPQTTD